MELETALKQLDEQADHLVGDDSEKGSGTGRDLLGSLMFAIYNIGLVLAFPLILGIMLAKQRCRGGLAQRLGWLPQNLAGDRGDAPTIWVHAVSMGEVNAVVPLVQELKARYPAHRVMVSTVTETGKETMLRQLEGLAQHLYFPFDFGFVVRKVLATMRPRLFVVVETELWPNFLREAAKRGVPCVLVNGRLSTDSFHGYLRLRPFFRRILQGFSLCLMQTDRDVERIVRLGADPARVVRTGNLKFDQQIASNVQPIALLLGAGEELFVAGSTHPAEEEVVLDCYRRLLKIASGLVLVIAPRHIERAEAVAAMVRAKGLIPLRKTTLGSSPEGRSPGPRVIILDTRGELAALYQQATLVFVGGSLVPIGGHSPVEPALCGKAVVFGSYMDHFAELADLLVSQGGGIQVNDGEELMMAMAALLKDRGRLKDMGRIAAQIVPAQQGTVAKNAELIAQLLEQGRATAHEPK